MWWYLLDHYYAHSISFIFGKIVFEVAAWPSSSHTFDSVIQQLNRIFGATQTFPGCCKEDRFQPTSRDRHCTLSVPGFERRELGKLV